MIQDTHIEEALKELFADLKFTPQPAGLYDPLRYMMEIGGKRIRPRLCLTSYSLYKDELSESILSPAAALEVFHSFTLIHDDIMDKADVRRGVPTVYRKWDENTAILPGDVMSIESYKLIAKAPADVLPQVLELFSKTAAEVCEGQQYDMDFENEESVPMADYLKMIGLKTAVLIACSAKMGDDWLDTYGDVKVFGKAIGGDILNNKKSWLLTRAFEKASEEIRERLLAAMGMPVCNDEEKAAKIAAVKDIYAGLGIDEDAKQEIIRLHNSAMAYISQLSLTPEKEARLRNYAGNLLGRTK